MFSKVYSVSVIGLDVMTVEVEVDVRDGLPGMQIVGFPYKACDQARERVKSAINNSGLEFPRQKITVNLAPADVQKSGTGFDLPIALGILAATSQVDIPHKTLVIGELSLDGNTRHVPGILPTILFAKEEQWEKVFIPYEDSLEASSIKDIKVYPIKHLGHLARFLKNELVIQPLLYTPFENKNTRYEVDVSMIKGQKLAKRALEIAAAGGHNMLMFGPPGAGKTMLASALPSILPPMFENEIFEVTKIYSIAGLTSADQPFITRRPFRQPHHTASDIAIVGGGRVPRPGEITLAHHGVLFLDELPEFPRSVLEVLRQPLEDRVITISRASGSTLFPASIMLIAAMNPCPCGYYQDDSHSCQCTAMQILKYQKKISGPLLDRIDLHVDVPRISHEELFLDEQSEASALIRERVTLARNIAYVRQGKNNAELVKNEIDQYCVLRDEAQLLLQEATKKMRLSTRSYYRILKISRTIADLNKLQNIESFHIGEALQYRPKSLQYLA